MRIRRRCWPAGESRAATVGCPVSGPAVAVNRRRPTMPHGPPAEPLAQMMLPLEVPWPDGLLAGISLRRQSASAQGSNGSAGRPFASSLQPGGAMIRFIYAFVGALTLAPTAVAPANA